MHVVLQLVDINSRFISKQTDNVAYVNWRWSPDKAFLMSNCKLQIAGHLLVLPAWIAQLQASS
jgi:hypothetical protein